MGFGGNEDRNPVRHFIEATCGDEQFPGCG